jgi:flagellar motor switch protein FliN/FliY
MEENKNIEENQEEVDQDKLAEEWSKMAEESQEEADVETPDENVDQEKLAEEWAKAAEMAPQEEEIEKETSESEKVAIEREKLEIFMDIPLEVSVEIGQTELPLEEILRLAPNSIVELDKFINQPVDLKVNGKLVAKGELYTIDNNFAIKITSIITAQERLKLFSEEFE